MERTDKQLLNMTASFTDLIKQQIVDQSNTYDFWKLLKKVNKEYLKIDVMSEGTFAEFLKYNYGIQLYYDDAGNIKPHYDIVNEHLYLIFKLKYA